MEAYEADTIEKYNRYFGFETRHPLVGIVHFDSAVDQSAHCIHFGFYSLFIKNTTGCIINYGKTIYDFDNDTVVSFAPGQTVSVRPTGTAAGTPPVDRHAALDSFLSSYQSKRLAILELGIGSRNRLIKLPLMQLTAQLPDVTYITLNLPHEIYVPEEIASKSIALPGDIARTLEQLTA